MNAYQALKACIEGTLVAQLAIQRDLSPKEVFTGNHIKALRQEIQDLGIDAELVSQAHLDAITGIFSTDKAIEELGTPFAELLWHFLGDPENGGKKPPQRYIEASQALWVTFLGAINPKFLATVQEMRQSHE